MECTKGEMKAGRINCGQFPISIDGRHVAMIKFTHLIDMKQDEANAKELVRRWNAFEKDGLVDELVEAFKELAATFVGLPEGSIGGQAMKKAEAAIAKVKS